MRAPDDAPAQVRARAAQSLAAGNPLEALSAVGPFNGPHALAIRGIALAQIGDYAEARTALGRAGRAFKAIGAEREQARAMAAEAEVSLALRDLGEARRGLEEAADILER